VNKINIVKSENSKILQKNIEFCKNNIIKNFNYWNKQKQFNTILSNTDLFVIFSDENEYDWLYNECKKFDLDLEKAIPSKKLLNEKSVFGGGSVNGNNHNELIFWQVIGSKSEHEMINTGNLKLFGHLFIHSIQVKFFLENSKNSNIVKITDYPCWFIEGQCDYHAIKELDTNFENHKNNFLKTGYVPDGYRETIKSWNIEEWKHKLKHDSNFEGIPITHQYWSGFFVYEYLINTYGIDLLIELMLDFIITLNFDVSMKKILNVNVNDFYDTMSVMLFNFSKFLVVR